MKPLLVLAGNQTEYLRWAREYRDEIEQKGFAPRYLPTNGINHLGYRDCFYTEVGSFCRSARNDELYRYFETHNIIKI